MNKKQKLFTYFGVSMVSAFAFAITDAIVIALTLPEADLAHRQMPFADPLFLLFMCLYAVISGLAFWPLYIVFGWDLPPIRVGITVGAIVLAFIVIVTPFDAGIGWLGQYVVLIGALVFSRISMKAKY